MVIYVSRTVREDQLLNQFLRFGRRDFQSTIGMLDPKLKSCLHFAGSFCINHQVDQIEGTLLHRVIVIYQNSLFHPKQPRFYDFSIMNWPDRPGLFCITIKQDVNSFQQFPRNSSYPKEQNVLLREFYKGKGPLWVLRFAFKMGKVLATGCGAILCTFERAY